MRDPYTGRRFTNAELYGNSLEVHLKLMDTIFFASKAKLVFIYGALSRKHYKTLLNLDNITYSATDPAITTYGDKTLVFLPHPECVMRWASFLILSRIMCVLGQVQDKFSNLLGELDTEFIQSRIQKLAELEYIQNDDGEYVRMSAIEKQQVAKFEIHVDPRTVKAVGADVINQLLDKHGDDVETFKLQLDILRKQRNVALNRNWVLEHPEARQAHARNYNARHPEKRKQWSLDLNTTRRERRKPAIAQSFRDKYGAMGMTEHQVLYMAERKSKLYGGQFDFSHAEIGDAVGLSKQNKAVKTFNRKDKEAMAIMFAWVDRQMASQNQELTLDESPQ